MNRALLALIALTLTAAPALAEKRRIVGILDVRIDGVPKNIASQFQQDLEKQLDSRSYWLAPRTRVHELMERSTKWTEGCVVGRCLAEVKTQTGAEIVLLAAITGSGTSFGYVVTLLRTDTGQMLSQEADRCDVCTVNEALTNATLAAVTLLTQVPDTLPDEVGAVRAEMARAEAAHAAGMATRRRKQRNLGFAMALTGLAVAAAGMAVYLVNDRADYGLATAAAGGGLAIGGAVALTF